MTEEKATRLFLHVGFPKTASSTLQKHLFARHPDLHYVGRPFSEPMASVEKAMLTLEDTLFERRLPDLRETFQQELSAAGNKPVLLSHEGFLRNTRYSGHDWARTAERIREVFVEGQQPKPDPHIVITLRNQADLLLSHFVQFVKGTQIDLDNEVDALLSDPSIGFGSSLFFSTVLDRYAALFGAEHLHVLLFEQFLADRSGFIRDLSQVLGIDGDTSEALQGEHHEKRKAKISGAYLVANQSSPYFALSKVFRRLGLAHLAIKAKSKSEHPICLSAQQLEKVSALYRDDNDAAHRKYDLPLARWGYPAGKASHTH